MKNKLSRRAKIAPRASRKVFLIPEVGTRVENWMGLKSATGKGTEKYTPQRTARSTSHGTQRLNNMANRNAWAKSKVYQAESYSFGKKLK